MSTATKTRLLTAEEFFDWQQLPENEGKEYELVRGEVVELSRPGERHGVVCGNVTWILASYVRKRQKGRVLTNDSGIILERDPDTVRGPDVVFFDDSKPYDQLNPRFPEGVPTLAVEVLSPTDRAGKTMKRIAEMMRAGIRLLWIIDPDDRDVTIYRPGHDPKILDASQEITAEDVLPGFSCKVEDLFFVAGH